MRSLRVFIVTLTFYFLLTLVLRVIFWAANWPVWQTLTTNDFLQATKFGLRFDLSIAVMATCLSFILLGLLSAAKVRRCAGSLSRFLPAIVLVFLMAGDDMYFDESSKHVGYEIHNVQGDWVALIATAFRSHAGLLFVHLAILGIFGFLVFWQDRRRSLRSPDSSGPAQPVSYPREIFSGAICIGIALILFRGGVQSIPLNPASAFTLGNPLQAAVALNGAYAIVQSVVRPNPFASIAIPAAGVTNAADELARLYLPPGVVNETVKRPNVVIILLEGWAAKYMRSYFGRNDSTPFFDTLRERSLSTDVLIADGNRTAMGLFAIFCSYQNPLGQAVAKTHLQFQSYDSLPAVLREKGWHTAFFQGTHRETSGVGAFAQSLGFQESFGMEDMPEGRYPRHSWGRHDPDIYDFAIGKMQSMARPFLVGINSNTTHSRELPPGVTPMLQGNDEETKTVNALRFADESLREFFDRYEKAALGPTIFVLAADHTSYAGTDGFLGHAIPFLLYAPDMVKPQRLHGAYHHRDIAPTVLDLLCIPIPGGFAGRSLIAAPPGFGDYYRSGALGWVEGDLVVEVPLAEPARVQAWNWRQDAFQTSPLPPGQIPALLPAKALTFARQSQSLLFAGRTREFRQRLKSP